MSDRRDGDGTGAGRAAAPLTPASPAERCAPERERERPAAGQAFPGGASRAGQQAGRWGRAGGEGAGPPGHPRAAPPLPSPAVLARRQPLVGGGHPDGR